MRTINHLVIAIVIGTATSAAADMQPIDPYAEAVPARRGARPPRRPTVTATPIAPATPIEPAKPTVTTTAKPTVTATPIEPAVAAAPPAATASRPTPATEPSIYGSGEGRSVDARIHVLHHGQATFESGPLPGALVDDPLLAGVTAGYVCDVTGGFWSYFELDNCRPAAIHGDSFDDSSRELAAAIRAAYPEPEIPFWTEYGWGFMSLGLLAIVGVTIKRRHTKALRHRLALAARRTQFHMSAVDPTRAGADVRVAAWERLPAIKPTVVRTTSPQLAATYRPAGAFRIPGYQGTLPEHTPMHEYQAPVAMAPEYAALVAAEDASYAALVAHLTPVAPEHGALVASEPVSYAALVAPTMYDAPSTNAATHAAAYAPATAWSPATYAPNEHANAPSYAAPHAPSIGAHVPNAAYAPATYPTMAHDTAVVAAYAPATNAPSIDDPSASAAETRAGSQPARRARSQNGAVAPVTYAASNAPRPAMPAPIPGTSTRDEAPAAAYPATPASAQAVMYHVPAASVAPYVPPMATGPAAYPLTFPAYLSGPEDSLLGYSESPLPPHRRALEEEATHDGPTSHDPNFHAKVERKHRRFARGSDPGPLGGDEGDWNWKPPHLAEPAAGDHDETHEQPTVPASVRAAQLARQQQAHANPARPNAITARGVTIKR